jgi:hypothetical protein
MSHISRYRNDTDTALHRHQQKETQACESTVISSMSCLFHLRFHRTTGFLCLILPDLSIITTTPYLLRRYQQKATHTSSRNNVNSMLFRPTLPQAIRPHVSYHPIPRSQQHLTTPRHQQKHTHASPRIPSIAHLTHDFTARPFTPPQHQRADIFIHSWAFQHIR